MKKLLINNITQHPYFPVFLFVVSIILSFGAFWYRDLFEGTRTLGLIGIFIINLISSATFLGASVGDLVSFAFGYSSRHVALKKFENKQWFIWVESLFRRHGVWIIFFFAFVPNPIFDAIGLIAGVFKFKWKTFFILILLGRFARFIILALLGAKFV